MATVKKDGGPAFPKLPDDIRNGSTGMSLRDWFAGMALAGIARDTTGDVTDSSLRLAAEEAYLYADAMLAERNK